ncbi:MAG: T9SS type A sorting domain-containing protein [Saprospiraceae bacterium]
MKKILLVFTLCLASLLTRAQKCIVYDYEGYQGDAYSLNLGESVTIRFVDTVLQNNPNNPTGPPDTIFHSSSPSWQLQSGAAVQLNWIGTPLSSAYPKMFIYSEQSAKGVGGTSQYFGSTLEVRCLQTGFISEPRAWIPIDKENINGENAEISVGDNVLLLRRAFIWENSEDHDCCHGPYGSVSLHVHQKNLLTDYNTDFNLIAQEYCGEGDVDFLEEPANDCNPGMFFQCFDFVNDYPIIGGKKVPGPIYHADNLCNDFGEGCGSFLGLVDDPKSEWIDGPWGVCYSRIPIYKWPSNTPNEIALILREGDDLNCDDFLGGKIVKKSDTGIIRLNAWMFGWLELENKVVTAEDISNSVDIADYYWNYNWNGANPEEVHSIPQTPPYDQFVPLPGGSILEMESTFPIGNTVGLIGGVFPKGVLSKPMTYKAACVPAVFGFDSQSRENEEIVERFQNNSSSRLVPLFPNPTSSYIQWSDEFGKNVSVINTRGEVLMISLGANQIDLSPLPQGIYFLRIQDDKGGIKYAKVMKK